ncbi:MAG: FtsQ-type POTRA domain-containing protein [Syntrophales bacterium]|nr:FtsQ-type POTRA domain-containing protein [Syntrophales bacterium]
MKRRFDKLARFLPRRKRVHPYRFEAVKYRLKKNSGFIIREVLWAGLFLGAVSGLVTIMIYLYAHVMSLPFLKVREVVVRGCQELTEKDVLTLAAIPPFRNMLVVGLEETRRRVMKNPWIKEAYVGREYPDRIVIAVKERVPMALVKRDRAFYLMDQEGMTFKKMEMGDPSDLPILTGCHVPVGADGRIGERSLALLRYLSSRGNYPHLKNVSEIHASERTGFSIFTDNGFCLQLGFDNFENKFKRLPTVLADLERRDIKAGFLHIDLSDPAMITVQRRQILPPAEASGSGKRVKT